LADPGICDANGESPEAHDLDGLICEAERDLAHAQRLKKERLLAAAQAAKQQREERDFRERMFEEMGELEGDHFAGYEDLEQMDLHGGGGRGDWMDDIAAEAELRRQAEVRQSREDRLRAAMRAAEEAREEAEAQEAKARAAAREDAERHAKFKASYDSERTSSSGPTPGSAKPKPPRTSASVMQTAEEQEEARLAARAADEARWRTFEEELKPAADASQPEEKKLRSRSIPWPSGPAGNPLHIDPGGHPSVVRSQLRSGLLRWHPDKFAQRFGALLPSEPAVKDKILDRVKEIAQQLNRLMAELSADTTQTPAQET